MLLAQLKGNRNWTFSLARHPALKGVGLSYYKQDNHFFYFRLQNLNKPPPKPGSATAQYLLLVQMISSYIRWRYRVGEYFLLQITTPN